MLNTENPPNQDRNQLRQVIRDVRQDVYLVVPNRTEGEDLAHQVRHFGYNVHIVTEIQRLKNAFAESKTVAILVDVTLSQDKETNLFDEIEQWNPEPVPVMFISDENSQEMRLKSIRAGGASFFTKPVDIVALIDRLDVYSATVPVEPYRILIVEDQATIANYYHMVLKMAGMRTEIVIDPSILLSKMHEFHPDLVLMDLYMPGVDGLELARIIRQIDDFVSTPIVFLSTEDDFSKQMEAMSVGGDDFLTKPIKSAHLVALIKSRLERLRRIKSLMIRDSLTGLLNHTAFFGQLSHEINRCLRQGTKLSVAMLDIDQFKLVNDTYGHALGDVVLKGLALLLKQRLRKSDIVGRYGGEEFAIALVDTDVESAAAVMNEIREHFSEVNHMAPDRSTFNVTFSCGIAEYPSFKEPSVLSKAADQALYEAKHAGRNQVKIAFV